MAGRKKIYDIVIMVAFGIFFGVGYLYYTYVETDNIKKDFSQTTGYIYEFAEPEHRGTTQSTRYKYTVDGKEYERGTYGMDACEGMEEFRSEIIAIKYTVVYSNSDPESSRLLVSPKQFEEYDLDFPAEMKRIYEKYWACK